jgi:hypothetical protein
MIDPSGDDHEIAWFEGSIYPQEFLLIGIASIEVGNSRPRELYVPRTSKKPELERIYLISSSLCMCLSKTYKDNLIPF